MAGDDLRLVVGMDEGQALAAELLRAGEGSSAWAEEAASRSGRPVHRAEHEAVHRQHPIGDAAID
ncbi:MAG: hypothetical protein ACK51F_14525, partial [Rhodospirillales bacterium]